MNDTLEAWLSVKLVEAPGELLCGLDEDRREAGRDEQGGGDQAQQLAVSGAQHARERTSPPGAGRPGAAARLEPARASLERRRVLRILLTPTRAAIP